MPDPKFTGITFSPITEFIEKTRKLRDLYGSSFILSYLSQSVCLAARDKLGQDAVVSPAKVNVTMGTPDVIIIRGNFLETAARDAFFDAWGRLMDACRKWVVEECKDWIGEARQSWIHQGEWRAKASNTLPWDRDWKLWKTYAWELFYVQGESIPGVLNKLAVVEEEERNWVGVNWIGESSTLSGADAIAWPGLDRNIPPKQQSMSETDEQIRAFYKSLKHAIGIAVLEDDLSYSRKTEAKRLLTLATRYGVDAQDREVSTHPDHAVFRQEVAAKLGEAIVTKRENLSIPELTKRLSTLKAIAQKDPLNIEFPDSFKDVNLWKTEHPMGWFRGDGDQAGNHIRQITSRSDDKAADNLTEFSLQMREWGQWLQQSFENSQDDRQKELGRIVFAGGDDFLGVFYADPSPQKAVNWLCSFKEDVWHKGKNGQPDRKPLTPSIGFVWASPQVPQRDILQHCEVAERRAKDGGRDRVCLRILFSSGTHLDWLCPWWLLPKIVKGYRNPYGDSDWIAFHKDVATLKARHAFQDNHRIALGLFNLYFAEPEDSNRKPLLPTDPDKLFGDKSPLWNQPGDPDAQAGILLDDLKKKPLDQKQTAFNQWVMSLAEVGFHLFNKN